VAENNDATLEQLREFFQKATNVLIGRSTVDRMLTKLNLSRKKKRSIQTKKKPNPCNDSA